MPKAKRSKTDPLGDLPAWAQKLAQRYYTAGRAETAISEWEKLEHLWVVVRITPRRIRSSS